MKAQPRLVRLTKMDEDKEVLVNWMAVTYVYPTSARGKGDYSDVYFIGGSSLPVKETTEEIQLLVK
jgi:hypothetical protein